MPLNPKDSRALYLVLERVSSLFRTQLRDAANEHGLKLVQLEVLVYLSVANRYSDTPTALVDYLGVTKGTVSQTVLALERRGLLEKRVDADDGRVVHCHLTDDGMEVADAAHPTFVHDGASNRQHQATLAAGLTVLRALQAGNRFRSFGQCAGCRHFRTARGGHKCGLTGEALSKDDATKICREHDELPPAAASS